MNRSPILPFPAESANSNTNRRHVPGACDMHAIFQMNSNLPISFAGILAAATVVVATIGGPAGARAESTSFATVIDRVQPRIVKIYGAGGLNRLEAYQSGLLISPEGHVLTVWSYVLDTEFISVVLHDGRKQQATLVGADPRLEIAVLKIDGADLPYFNLDESPQAEVGDRVLAFSNLFGVATGDEAASVLHGSVAARTQLSARRSAFQTPYQGPVYVLDAMTNNPGSAGGALTDRQGRLLGLLGKELKNSLNNTWLNYAAPAGELSQAVRDILAGKSRPRSQSEDVEKPSTPLTLAMLGLQLAPDVLDKTPPFIDRVRPGSPAAAAGLRPDDLILFVNGRLAASCQAVRDELSFVDQIDKASLTVQRGQELIEVQIGAAPER